MSSLRRLPVTAEHFIANEWRKVVLVHNGSSYSWRLHSPRQGEFVTRLDQKFPRKDDAITAAMQSPHFKNMKFGKPAWRIAVDDARKKLKARMAKVHRS